MTSHNMVFKQWLLSSLELREGFQGSFSVDDF